MKKAFRYSLLVCLLWTLTPLFAQDTVTRVTEPDAKRAIVSKVAPQYPSIARQMRVSGRVQLELTVDEAGAVEKATVVSGNPLLTSAAMNAVKKWKFTPFKAGGKPTRAVTTMTFTFEL